MSKEKKLKYHGDTIFLKKHKRPLRYINIGAVFLAHQQRGLTDDEHRAIYKPMNQGIRRNGREA